MLFHLVISQLLAFVEHPGTIDTCPLGGLRLGHLDGGRVVVGAVVGPLLRHGRRVADFAQSALEQETSLHVRVAVLALAVTLKHLHIERLWSSQQNI